MNNSIQLTVEQINKMNPLDIVKNEAVKSRFIEIRSTIWRDEDAESVYEKESRYFSALLDEKPELRDKSTPFSIFTAFIDLAVCGLSLEPGARAQCYLMGRNAKIGQHYDAAKGKNVYDYEGRCVLTISGYGELVQRQRCGQIRYADNPTLVYAEDEFSFSDKDGRKSVSYTCHLPHTSGHIVAAFLRITRNDGSVDYSVMYEEDWLRLMNYSLKNNTRYNYKTNQWEGQANELYGNPEQGVGIDSGFLCAKLIKHAFKTYPKLRIGKGTELQTEQEEPQPEIDDYYGVKGGVPEEKPQPQEPFGNQPDFSGGVKVEDSNDGAF